MKRTGLTLFLLFWTSMLAFGQGSDGGGSWQSRGSDRAVRVGVRAGGSASRIVSSHPAGSWIGRPSRMGHGGYIVGAVVEFRVARMFSVQPELLVAMKGARLEGDVEIVRTTDGQRGVAREVQRQDLTYLELPVNFVLKVPLGGGFLNIAAGPYVSYGVAGNLEGHFYHGDERIDAQIDNSSLKARLFTGPGRIYRPWDFGLNAMVGWEFGFGLFVDAGYSHGLISIASDRAYNDRNSALSLTAGWKF